MLAAVLFELEMVLIDTAAARLAAVRSALDPALRFDDADYERLCAGRSTRDAVAALMAERAPVADATDVDLAVARCERAVETEFSRGSIAIMPGARQCLDGLAGRARIAVVTRATRRETEAMLARWDEQPLFECIVTRDDVRAPKPAPDGHRLALRRLGTRAPLLGRIVAIEDAAAGHEAASAAGIEVVAIGDLLLAGAERA